MKYRKKPVEVNAMRIGEILANHDAAPDWVKQANAAGLIQYGSDFITIKTLEGELRGEPRDILIQGVAGEVYPCKPDIFEATYEAVDAKYAAEVGRTEPKRKPAAKKSAAKKAPAKKKPAIAAPKKKAAKSRR